MHYVITLVEWLLILAVLLIVFFIGYKVGSDSIVKEGFERGYIGISKNRINWRWREQDEKNKPEIRLDT